MLRPGSMYTFALTLVLRSKITPIAVVVWWLLMYLSNSSAANPTVPVNAQSLSKKCLDLLLLIVPHVCREENYVWDLME